MRAPLIIALVGCLLAGPAVGQTTRAASVTYDISLPPVPAPVPPPRQLVGIAEMQLAVADTFLNVWDGRLEAMRKELTHFEARMKTGLTPAETAARQRLLAGIASAEARIRRLQDRRTRIRNEYQLALRVVSEADSPKSKPSMVASEPASDSAERMEQSDAGRGADAAGWTSVDGGRYSTEGFSDEVAQPTVEEDSGPSPAERDGEAPAMQ